MVLPNEDGLPLWVTIFERIGPGASILIFVLATLWKLLPKLIALIGSWKKQSDTITAAIPRFERGFEKVASDIGRGFDRMENLIENRGAVATTPRGPDLRGAFDPARAGGHGHPDDVLKQEEQQP